MQEWSHRTKDYVRRTPIRGRACRRRGEKKWASARYKEVEKTKSVGGEKRA